MTQTILTVVGARPQFIKAGPVSRAIAAAGIREVLVHTGQHYDREMSEQFFEELQIRPPDLNLNVGSGSHADQTSRMMAALEAPMVANKPDWVVVYGDTNSTLAAAIVASKLQLPIAHVEAGVRSYDRRIPEEINRVVTDVLSDILFAPTATACSNLAAEGISGDRVRVVGDVMFDAALQYRALLDRLNFSISSLGLTRKDYVLTTIHRADNTDDPFRLRLLLDSINAIAADTAVVFPVHPRTQKLIDGWTPAPNVRLTRPLGYLQTMQLIANAAVVLTDSGGLQKEAFFQRVPCVTLRPETPWSELVTLGWNRLAPPESVSSVVTAVRDAWGTVGMEASPYGDGTASVKIVKALQQAQASKRLT